jgi:carboxyl-terminal processing protease
VQAKTGNTARGGSKTKVILKTISLTAGAALIFLFGMGVGNGSVGLGLGANVGASNKHLPEDLNYASVERVYDLVRANYDGKLDEAKLLEGLKKGLTSAAGDPYTQYFDPARAQKFQEQLDGSYTGIGAELGKDDQENLIIVSPISGFPASKAGLRPQDVIASINNESTSDMAIEDAITKIRGPKNTEVTLRIIRNKSEDLTIKIVRDDIKLPSVKWEVKDDIGMISISQFSRDTYELMTNAAIDVKSKGAKKILLDLRGNPGGELNNSISISEMWVPNGKLVLQQKRGGLVTKSHISDISGDPIFKDMPTAVLIDEGSASASEIVAGALQDNKLATLYGQKSYGKGSVQEVSTLPGGGEVKITVARWYTPSGLNIDKKGITPDKEIKMTEDDYKNKRDPQKDAALEFLRTK